MEEFHGRGAEQSHKSWKIQLPTRYNKTNNKTERIQLRGARNPHSLRTMLHENGEKWYQLDTNRDKLGIP